jgi:hypothetical protein
MVLMAARGASWLSLWQVSQGKEVKLAAEGGSNAKDDRLEIEVK